jgi:hypothetical protein
LLVIREGETAAEILERIQKKLRVPDEEFSKVTFIFMFPNCSFTICSLLHVLLDGSGGGIYLIYLLLQC